MLLILNIGTSTYMSYLCYYLKQKGVIKTFNNYTEYLLKEIYPNLNVDEQINLLFTRKSEYITKNNKILIPYYPSIEKNKNLECVEINNEIYYIDPHAKLNVNSEFKFNKYYSSIQGNNCLIYSILIILNIILEKLKDIDHNIYNKMKNELQLFTNSNKSDENFFTDTGPLFKIFKDILGECYNVEYTDNINKILINLP